MCCEPKPTLGFHGTMAQILEERSTTEIITNRAGGCIWDKINQPHQKVTKLITVNNPDGKVTISRKLLTIENLIIGMTKSSQIWSALLFKSGNQWFQVKHLQRSNLHFWSSNQLHKHCGEKSASFLCYRILISHGYLKIMKWTCQCIYGMPAFAPTRKLFACSDSSYRCVVASRCKGPVRCS